MKAAPFDYLRAESLAQACEQLHQHGDDAKLIAGGQSLTPMMAMRLVRPAYLIDIHHIAALHTITVEHDVVRTAACVRQCVAARDDALAARVPLLRQALAWVGHTQTRNRGTLGGSLAHADPAAELPLVAQVLCAEITARAVGGARTLRAAKFFVGPLSTALNARECLETVQWPVWSEPRTGSAFTEVSRRHGDFALIAACAQLALDDDGRCTRATFGLGGGGSIPMAFPALAARLIGTRLDADTVRSVAHDAAIELAPSGDLHAGADYRTHLASTLTIRVLQAAYTAAQAKP